MKPFGITLLRVTVGAILLMHAYRMMLVTRPQATAGFIAHGMGFSHATILAWIVIVVHALGGLLLVVGMFTRPVAALNALILGLVLVRVNLTQGFFLAGAEEGGLYRATVAGYEFILLLTVSTLALLLLGSGPLALRPSK